MPTEDISFTDLMASSIHDMKNAVNIQVQTLERVAQQIQGQVEPSAFDSLVAVVAQAHCLDANLIELLTLYKVGKSIYPLDIQEQTVAEVIHEVLLQKASMFALKGIEIETVCSDALRGYFDRDLITGVLLNALNNAYQFSINKICITASFEAPWLTLRVEDNGPGYPEQMLRSDAVLADKGVNFFSGSTGLGFYFCDQVVKMHKNRGQCGSLSVENGGAYGGGCFVIRLP